MDPQFRALHRARVLRYSSTALLAVLVACSPSSEPPTADASSAAKVLTRGGPFRGVNGIMFGPDGKLYIASVVTPAIAVLDPETGKIEQRWEAAQGVKGPDDLAFAPDGTLYWTDISFGEVSKRSPDGTTTVVASLGAGVNPITFSDDGRLFVSQCFMGDKLYEVDTSGAGAHRLISDQLGPGCGLNGMDWGPDGKLYGPRWFRGEVARIDVDTGAVEAVADGFKVPAAVKFDSKGRLHVLDSLAGEVVRVDLATGAKEVVGHATPGLDNLAFTADDRLFVSSFADGFVVEITGPSSVREVSPGGVNMPGGIAFAAGDGGGRLFLADFFALRELDPATGEPVHTVREVIGFSDQGSVMSVHWSDGQLVLSSWFDNLVRLWDPDEDRLLARFEVQLPIDALTFAGELVVSEYARKSVIRFDPAEPGERSTVIAGLIAPAGLATDGKSLYVADRGAGSVLQIASDGELLDEPRSVATGLAGPEGLALGADGTLYVVEAEGHAVTSIDPATGATRVLASGLEIHVPSQADYPATMLLNGIAAGDGRLYVTGDVGNLVYTIDL